MKQIRETYNIYGIMNLFFFISSFISRVAVVRGNQAQVDKVRSLWKQSDMLSELALSYHEVCPGKLMLNINVFIHFITFFSPSSTPGCG